MSDKNMALLSQSEIDALIEFLNQQKGVTQIKGDTLSQNSINKLIQLIKSAQFTDKSIPINFEALDFDNEGVSALPFDLPNASFRLTFSVDEVDGILLFATNTETSDSFAVTPSGISKTGSTSCWGRCMAPTTFDYLAKKLDLQYSDHTFEQVKKQFAKVMYGDENAVIPTFYLP